MNRLAGARERARAEITAAILDVARQHLASEGAPGLSLRAVARELGMASSGVYRYFASRDDLLTRLIIEAYDALGEQAEQAARSASRRAPAARFAATCRSIRDWARGHPHEYALLYGTPVPGYAAPTDTIPPALRVPLALLGIIADAHAHGRLTPPADAVALPAGLREDLDRARAAIALDLPDAVLVRAIAAWTQVFGLITFELFGQTAGGVFIHHDELFEATTASMAVFVGL